MRRSTLLFMFGAMLSLMLLSTAMRAADGPLQVTGVSYRMLTAYSGNINCQAYSDILNCQQPKSAVLELVLDGSDGVRYTVQCSPSVISHSCQRISPGHTMDANKDGARLTVTGPDKKGKMRSAHYLIVGAEPAKAAK